MEVWFGSFAALVQIQAWKLVCLLLPEHAETGTAEGTGNQAAEKQLRLRDGFSLTADKAGSKSLLT